MKLVFIFLSIFTAKFAIAHDKGDLYCQLSWQKVSAKLTDQDWNDPANSAYRKPYAKPFCKIVFELCPSRYFEHYQNMGKITSIKFLLKSRYHDSKFQCRFVRPAAINRGGADESYFTYKKIK